MYVEVTDAFKSFNFVNMSCIKREQDRKTHIYIYVYINIYREKFGNSFF